MYESLKEAQECTLPGLDDLMEGLGKMIEARFCWNEDDELIALQEAQERCRAAALYRTVVEVFEIVMQVHMKVKTVSDDIQYECIIPINLPYRCNMCLLITALKRVFVGFSIAQALPEQCPNDCATCIHISWAYSG
jgi:hypothetical protein